MFFKKNPKEKLEAEYAKKMDEYRMFMQKGDRMKSDLAYAEAEAIMNKLVELKNASKS